MKREKGGPNKESKTFDEREVEKESEIQKQEERKRGRERWRVVLSRMITQGKRPFVFCARLGREREREREITVGLVLTSCRIINQKGPTRSNSKLLLFFPNTFFFLF